MAAPSCQQPAKKLTRFWWSERETEQMLQVIADLQVVDKIASTRQRNMDVFKRVAAELKRRRISKDWHQIRTKWKTMKRSYLKARRTDNVAVATTASPKLPACHLEILHSMLGNLSADKFISTDEGEVDEYNNDTNSFSASDPATIGVQFELQEPEEEVSHILPTFYSYEDEVETSGDSDIGVCTKVANNDVPPNETPLIEVTVKQEIESTNESTSMEAPSQTLRPDVVPREVPMKRKRNTAATKQEQAFHNYAERHKALMLDMQERQQVWAEQQMERQRQWEESMFTRFQDNFARTTENMTSTFITGMQAMFRSPLPD